MMITPIASRSIIDCCQKNIIDLKAIYLFGSQVTGYANAESDIDLAILCLKPLSAETRWELSHQLSQLLNRQVDLVDLKEATTVMQWQILTTGNKIFCADETYNAFFEMYALSDYIRLNEQRRDILDDIKKRGSIYGK